MTGPSTYYVVDGGTPQTATTSFTTTTGIDYSWTLENSASYDDGHVRISGNSVEYYNSYGTETTLTLRAVATHTASSTVSTATSQTLTFMPLSDPTSLTISSGNTMTVYVGSTGNITYSLQTTPCYDNVTFASDAISVASVNASGVVTGVSTGTATITVTAHKLDGTTNPSLTKTVTVTVKDKVATPVITLTPDPLDNTRATATITCATPGATIYYKVNSDAYAEYTTGVELDEYDAITAYAVMSPNPGDLWDNSDETTDTYISCSTPDPTISYVQSGTTATVTITAEPGATIYYTTDGSTPTAAASTSVITTVTLNTIAGGTTIKAYAKNGTCSASNIVTNEIAVSGVSGGVVTLNDFEDHNWSYYQPHGGIDASYGYPDELCSPYPRNVKITYYGYGNNTLSTSDAAAPAASTFSTNTTTNDVKVGIGEDGHTFVYYKTLERDANGLYPYRMIFNPFYVRPKSGDTYTGFYKWRVKSVTGGSISNAGGTTIATTSTTSANNVWLDADETYYFNPTDNGETNVNNATSMTVEFEALWAAAEVITTGNFSKGYNSVERNFYVRRSNAASNVFSGTTPCTYSSFYPNGTTNGTTAAVMNNRVSVQSGTAKADSKVEYHIWSNTTALNTGGFKVDIGRGMTASGNGPSLTPLTGDHDSDKNARLRIETGTYNGGESNLYGTPTVGNNLVHLDLILGSDYDRAKGDNTQLTFAQSNRLVHGAHEATGARWLSFQHLDILVKSGRIQYGYRTQTSADYRYTFYCRSTLEAEGRYPGISYLTVEGGEFASINGGRGNRVAGVALEDDIVFSLRIKGGTIHGSIYGAASANPSFGGRRVIMTGGTVEGWIAGGCDGTSSSGGGATLGNSYFYIGGNGIVGTTTRAALDGTEAGNVFGAGRGMSNHGTSTNPASMKNAFIAVADNGFVLRNVYGGGDYGYTGVVTHDGQTDPATAANFYILGGTVNGAVHGGGNNNNSACTNANIYMTGGLVKGGIYGGSNNNGTMSYNVTMHIDGGQVGVNPNTPANIHGGGYGSPTRVNGNVDITLGKANQTEPGVIVYGDVYGGSALGYVNGTTATNTYHTNVTLNKGTINGSLYGGALGAAGTAANVYGPVAVKVYGGSVNTTSVSGSGAVYGCNNIYGAPQRAVTVDIYGTDPAPDANSYALDAVYGGGNQANYSYGTPTVTVHNCDNSIGYVYGGGNAAHITNGNTDVTIYGGNKIGNVFGGGNGTVTAANVSGNTNVKIYGGTIGKVFGGSNSQGTIGGTISVTVEKQGDSDPEGSSTACEMHIDEVYGGGNMAASKAGSIAIGCTGGEGEGIGDVYGGANQANITGNIALNITGGSIERVFGGNNISGNISGTIQVDVNWNTANPCAYNHLGSVFGGGNLATYTGSPAVNILNGTVSGNVYGGGAGVLVDGAQRGEQGKVTGNPTVTIGDNDNGHTAIVLGDVYGGGDAADVAGTPVIVVNDCNTQIGYLYGGGNAADVNGTNITFNAGTVTHDAFGGGHGDKDASSPSKYADVNGNVVFNVYGGTIDRLFAGSNSKGTITGSSALNINKTGNCAMKIREVYGGGNEAAGNAGTVTVGCTGTLTTQASTPEQIGTTLEGIGAVYGGANQADIGTSGNNSNITLTINSGMVGNVYGGNNTSGTIYGDIQVNINKTSDACGWYVGDVFGGGNLADYSGTPDVNIQAGTVSGSVFGGGNAASVGGSDVAMTGGQVNGGIYGGCNASGNTGAVTIALTGGQVGTSGTSADVFGGGFGSATTTSGNIGVTLGGTTVYGDLYGGSALGSVNASTSNTTTLTINGSNLHGTIYGGGKGDNSTTAVSNGNVLINYNTANTSLTGLYGGANINGNVKGDITLNVLANVGASGSGNSINVFGGGLGHLTGTEGDVTVNVGTADGSKAPVVYGDIYGGSALGNVNNAVADRTTVSILNGTVHGNVYGGGLGDATVNTNGYLDPTAATVEAIVNGTVHVNIGHETTATSTPTIDGKVFGCNNLAGTPKGHVYVDVYRTAHSAANTYPSPEPASASAIPTPAATEFAIQEVYGGGNLAHYTTSLDDASTHVHIHTCANTIQYVYGGGNAADTKANEVTIDGGRFEYVFGGGNGKGTGNPGANVEGDATVNINGGIINYVFGGSNTKGVVNGTASMDFATSPTCTRMVKELYGGGNEAPGGAVDLTIPCGVTGLNEVYGGSRNADIGSSELFNAGTKKNVTLTVEGGNLAKVFGGNNQGGIIWGDVELNLKGGTIVDAFGGNNAGGNIKGSITVNVEEDESLACPLVLTNVFGGGKDAAYTPADATISFPQVNIKHKKSGTSITGSVFGGGQGATATVTANPVVTVGDLTAGHESYIASIGGDVYGGGDAAGVVGSTTVLIQKCNTVIGGDVYGGGNAADVNGTSVTVTGGTITGTGHGMVFGGGHGDNNPANLKVANVNGNVAVVINGGTINKVFAGSNLNGSITGSTSVNVNKTGSCAMKIAEVYGGGNVAAGNAGTVTIGCTGTLTTQASNPAQIGTTLEGVGTVYGGANQADIGTSSNNSNITLTINSGIVGNVFGGNNTSGDIHGTIQVNINKDNNASCASDWYVGDVYGGGNMAAYAGTPDVNIQAGTVSGKVFGGGNEAGVGGGDVSIVDGAVLGGIYGGCNTEGTVSGDITVTLTGGTVGVNNAATNDGVFGGGFGHNTATTGDVAVTLGGTTVYGDLYGGSALGSVGAAGKTTTITINGSNLHGTVYGGGMGEGSDNDHRATTLGDVVINYNTTNANLTGIYGGANVNGSVTGDIALNVLANVGASGSRVDVFGGGLGAATATSGNVTVTIGDKNGTSTPVIYGDIYGGSSLGVVNDAAADLTKVDILSGSITGNVYGGGMGEAGAANVAKGQVNGKIIVNVGTKEGNTYYGNASFHTYTVSTETLGGNVYGCNNTNGSPQDNVTVNIYKTANNGTTDVATYTGNDRTYAINQVFGGGRNANYTATGKKATVNLFTCDNTVRRVFGGGDAAAVPGTVVYIEGGRFDYVFGGGNGEMTAANVGDGGIILALHGGNIGTLVSGSNTQGTISGAINVTVDNEGSCPEEVNDFFGGSNQVDIATSVTTTIACGAGTFNNVYGGSNAANITGNVVLNVYGGTMNNVFGGSKGVLQVGTSGDPNYVAPVAANITGNVTLNLYGGTIGNAFGGSNYNGNITGDITVNVLDHEGTCKLDVTNIYGAGNLTAYTPTNASASSPTLNVMHIKVTETVPGIRGSVYGAGKGDPNDASQVPGMVTANPKVNIGYDATTMASLATVDYPAGISRDSYTAVICGNLIGGGDAAKVVGSPVVTVYKGQVKERIIGGGNAANVTGSTHIVINDGTFGTGTGASRGVYGGCNTTGTVTGNSQVDILGGTFGTQADINNRIPYNIHGGGFGEPTRVNGDVLVNYGDDDGTTEASAYPKLYGDLYGGSALGDINTDVDNTTTVNVLNGSFGFSEERKGYRLLNCRTENNVTVCDTAGGYKIQYGGNVYGGGLGQKAADATAEIPDDPNTPENEYRPAQPALSAIAAKVNGVVHVNIGKDVNGTYYGKATLAHCNVYGCNNANGSPQENVFVDVYQTAHTTKNSYGYESELGDKDEDLFAIKNVYGGGNAADFSPEVNPTGKWVQNTIHKCTNTIENTYGGGNAADVTNAKVYVEGGRFKYIFAGGNGQITAANVVNNAEMTILAGRVGWSFEGCNMQGHIGHIDLEENVQRGCPDGQTCECGDLIIENHYFGNNMATVYDGISSVIDCGASFQYRNVYAGSRLATIYGNVELTVRGGNIGNLFGGSEGSEYITANIKKYPTSYEDIDNFPEDHREGLRAYFANHAHDEDYGTGGNIILRLEGGTIKNVFGGCNYNGNVEGNIEVIVNASQTCPLEIDYLYGGSYLAGYAPDSTGVGANRVPSTNPTRISPLVRLLNGRVNHDVYGASHGGDPTHIFGNGVVYSNPKVIVGDNDPNHSEHTFEIGGNLYGGGKSSDVYGSTEVIIVPTE